MRSLTDEPSSRSNGLLTVARTPGILSKLSGVRASAVSRLSSKISCFSFDFSDSNRGLLVGRKRGCLLGRRDLLVGAVGGVYGDPPVGGSVGGAVGTRVGDPPVGGSVGGVGGTVGAVGGEVGNPLLGGSVGGVGGTVGAVGGVVGPPPVGGKVGGLGGSVGAVGGGGVGPPPVGGPVGYLVGGLLIALNGCLVGLVQM